MWQDEWLRVRKRIGEGPMPAVTLRVFCDAIGNLEYNTGVVRISREQLAELAGVSPSKVSQAMGHLQNYGAVIRRPVGRGVVYVVSPAVMWFGDEAAQAEAAKLFVNETYARLAHQGKVPPIERHRPQPNLELVGGIGP